MPRRSPSKSSATAYSQAIECFGRKMFCELVENDARKGNFLDWKPDFQEGMSELDHHVHKLRSAFQTGDAEQTSEYCADIANACLAIDMAHGINSPASCGTTSGKPRGRRSILYQTMNKRFIDQAIAESAGWEFRPPPVGGASTSRWRMPDGGYTDRLPDFTNSCTAIKNIIKKRLGDIEFERAFDCELLRVLKRDLKRIVTDFDIALADAYQLCEAYLRAIDKWPAT